ncbi:MAG: chemotaxis protein CheD [Oscillospiraceae bacterium]|jgi:chemotaxis protein CheD|nr:chemotaxis protein CheD [Oscillospiraceae bacterium]
MALVNIGISDLNIARPPDTLVTYALGSCVGICLVDNRHTIGGLAHIMLPSSLEASDKSGNMRRYADTGIRELVQMMMRNGVMPSGMVAKIAGGAQMFATKLQSFNIGERNVESVKKVLADFRIRIVAQDTGLNYGRTVFFNPADGAMQIKSANGQNKVL